MSHDTAGATEPGAWCVVANVVKEHRVGPGGNEIKIGTRLFRGGSKVYIAGCYPGTCDGVVAIGLHRKSRRFITAIVDVMHLENFRAKVAYHPHVIERIQSDDRCWFATQEDAEQWAAAFPKWQAIWRRSPDTGAAP